MNMTKAYPHTARSCGHRHGCLVINPLSLLLSITCIWLLVYDGMVAADDSFKQVCYYTQWELQTEQRCLSWCRWCHPSSPFLYHLLHSRLRCSPHDQEDARDGEGYREKEVDLYRETCRCCCWQPLLYHLLHPRLRCSPHDQEDARDGEGYREKEVDLYRETEEEVDLYRETEEEVDLYRETEEEVDLYRETEEEVDLYRETEE